MARRITGDRIVIANRLDDGMVVFMCNDLSWCSDPANARVFSTDNEANAAMIDALDAEEKNIVVGPTAIEVEFKDGKPWPKLYREAIRAQGPTVRRDLGYQAWGR